MDGVSEYFENANEDLITIVQIETERGVENVDEIVTVNGVVAMMEELIANHGFSEREAYIHMSINPGITARTYQFIRPGFFTVGVKFNKGILEQFSEWFLADSS